MLSHQGLSSSPSFAFPGRGDLIAGRYRVERKLGAGGMGLVVAAVDEQMGIRVAVKLLLPEGPMPSAAFQNQDESGILARSNRHQEMSTRLVREASAAARLSSEHVTRVLDVGRLDHGDPYVVMELLEGVDLGKYAKQRGPLPIVEAVTLVLQACEAIVEAHAHGIVHRDLKPANLFLTRRNDGSPFVKVLDFGISKVLGSDDNQLTGTTDMLGSPLYMAPEQIRNARDVDARADVWSMGTILYRLLAGRAAFESDGSAATLAAIIGDSPVPLRAVRPDVPPDLEGVVQRCLEKDRTRRIQTVRELAVALTRFAHVQTGAFLQVPPLQQSGGHAAAMPSFPTLTPGGGVPAMTSVAPNAVTVSGPRGRPAAVLAALALVVAAMVGGGLVAWKLLAGSAVADGERSGDGPVAGAATVAASTSAASAASTPGATSASPASSATAAPSDAPTSNAGAANPSTAAGSAAASAAGASATSAPTSAPAKPAARPTHARPSDDPLGDRL